MRLEARVEHRPRGFKTEETPADHGGAPGPRPVGEDGLEVVDRAVDEDAVLVDARDGRHERRRTRGEDQDVVAELLAVVRRHDSSRPVQARHAPAEAQIDPAVLVPSGRSEEQRVGRALRKVRREMNAVVRGSGLLPDHDQMVGFPGVALEEPLAEAMADHPVSGDHDAREAHDGLFERSRALGSASGGARCPGLRSRCRISEVTRGPIFGCSGITSTPTPCT